jgi:hypothetical protein
MARQLAVAAAASARTLLPKLAERERHQQERTKEATEASGGGRGRSRQKEDLQTGKDGLAWIDGARVISVSSWQAQPWERPGVMARWVLALILL